MKSLLFGELCVIAHHLVEEKDYGQAVSYFQEALNLRPDAAELRPQLAEAQLALSKEVKADREEHIQETTVSLHPFPATPDL